MKQAAKIKGIYKRNRECDDQNSKTRTLAKQGSQQCSEASKMS